MFQLPGVHEAIIAGWMEKWGVDNPLSAKEVQEKILSTIFRKYGVDHVWKCPEIAAKCIETKIRLYGSIFQSNKYKKDGIVFDSSWEVIVWDYCKMNGIEIVRSPVHFKYFANGKSHTYFVDFSINGALVEVKGDQFFNEQGIMKPPARGKLSDKTYEELCAIYAAKQQCMILNHVIVYKGTEVMKFLDAIQEKDPDYDPMVWKIEKKEDEDNEEEIDV